MAQGEARPPGHETNTVEDWPSGWVCPWQPRRGLIVRIESTLRGDRHA
jgi:hypothetical protein